MAENRGVQAQAILHALNRILGISQERIAAGTGVSFTTANAWMNGRRVARPKQIDRLRRFARKTLKSTRGLDEKARLLATICIESKDAISNSDNALEILLREVLSLKAATVEAGAVYDFLRKHSNSFTVLADNDFRELESEIYAAGHGSVKMQSIIKTLRQLVADFAQASLSPLENFDDRHALEYLRQLPGVDLRIARKTLMLGMQRNVFPVDSGVYRVALRLGLIPTCKTSVDAHDAFDAILSRYAIPARVLYGALTAVASIYCANTAPNCSACPLLKQCPTANRHAQIDFQPRARILPAPRPAMTAIDLYAGCGGLSLGLRQAGYDVRFALDWDRNACATHSHNLSDCVVECTDVRSVSSAHVLSAAGGHVDLIAGGPNCQGVSQRGLRSPDDPRNFMFPEFLRLVHDIKPRAFLMENVPGLAHRHNYGLLRTIFAEFEKLGYNCGADVLLAANFGVPQLRYRFFLIGILDGEHPITFPIPTHTDSPDGTLFRPPFVNVWDALSDLPYISEKQQRDIPLPYGERAPLTEYQRAMRHDSDTVHNHVVSATDPINLERASFIPEGGNWKDIPPDLLPERFLTCRMTDHSTTYARLRRDCPAFTITALFGNITAGAFLHPIINRALTIREGARLQSFPDKFIFQGPRNSQYRQIGNAVPPLLAKVVSQHLLQQLRQEPTHGSIARISPEVLSSERNWDALPVLTPRFKQLFGSGTRWPKGWGPEPARYGDFLDGNYTLRAEFHSLARRLQRAPMTLTA